MRRGSLAALIALALAVGAALATADASAPAGGSPRAPRAVSIELTGTIDPATAGWIASALDDAAGDRARLAIIRLDTPGGLDSSMRKIVRAILGAPLPVAVYVSPDGARAASAGLFVTMAADVAAMAPQTNIGSATPIQLGGGATDEVLGRKIRNDASAYVRALAEAHGRDAALAERMVRAAVNVTARDALRQGLVDVVAPDERALLERLDGFAVRGPKARTLHTAGLRIERRDMPLRYELQQLLVNPTIAYLLLLGGLLGIAFELLSPGLGGPGLAGAIALLLGLYGSAQLPVTAGGIVLIVLAIALFAAEAHVGGFGVLGLAGIGALIAGGLLLFDTGSDAYAVSAPIAAAVGATLGACTLFVVSRVVAVRRAPKRGATEDLVGALASVRVALDPIGQVYVQGALWRARLEPYDAPAPAGAHVRVERVDGLTLTVHPEPKELP